MLVAESCDLARLLVDRMPKVEGVDVVIAPPFTSLYPVGQIIKNSRLGLAGQNFYFENHGAYTGEISPEMLKDLGCGYALIGHSERRRISRENNQDINHKVHRAVQTGMTAVVCVGESLDQREADQTLNTIETQLTEGLAGFSDENRGQLTIEYEPVWAIGTGVNANPEQVFEIHRFIRGFLIEKLKFSEVPRVRIIYGGSVSPENCNDLLLQDEIDGLLVGGASLNFDSFYAIINSALGI